MNEHAAQTSKATRTAASGDHVVSALSLAIHEHRLAPGTKLGEDDLVKQKLHELVSQGVAKETLKNNCSSIGRGLMLM